VEASQRDRVRDWLNGYERAWRSPGTVGLRELFTEDATYSMGPYEQPRKGLPAIAELWEEERDGADEIFTMASAIVAVDGDIAVVRVNVGYGDPASREYRDLWLIELAADGRCRAFEEWPFWPGQPVISPSSSS
jgi:ketosteroid isomerase-like protein